MVLRLFTAMVLIGFKVQVRFRFHSQTTLLIRTWRYVNTCSLLVCQMHMLTTTLGKTDKFDDTVSYFKKT